MSDSPSPLPATKVMIVDDEPAARNRMESLLKDHPQLQIVATAGGVAEGVEAFRIHRPDLVFLDVEMKDGTGFDLLPFFDPLPKIIFVTAHPHFAVKAFEVRAVDYLLKPVFANRLNAALARILEPIPASASAESPSPSFQMDDVLFLRTSQGSVAVATSDIAYIEAEGNFSHVHSSGNRKVMIYRTLGQWEQRLPENCFFRVDRSLLVNLSTLEKVHPVGPNVANLHLRGMREPLSIGRSAYRRLRSKIEL